MLLFALLSTAGQRRTAQGRATEGPWLVGKGRDQSRPSRTRGYGSSSAQVGEDEIWESWSALVEFDGHRLKANIGYTLGYPWKLLTLWSCSFRSFGCFKPKIWEVKNGMRKGPRPRGVPSPSSKDAVTAYKKGNATGFGDRVGSAGGREVRRKVWRRSWRSWQVLKMLAEAENTLFECTIPKLSKTHMFGSFGFQVPKRFLPRMLRGPVKGHCLEILKTALPLQNIFKIQHSKHLKNICRWASRNPFRFSCFFQLAGLNGVAVGPFDLRARSSVCLLGVLAGQTEAMRKILLTNPNDIVTQAGLGLEEWGRPRESFDAVARSCLMLGLDRNFRPSFGWFKAKKRGK